MSFSNYYENALLNFLFRGEGFLTPTLYLGLVHNVVDSDTGITCDEVDVAFYSRKLATVGFAVASLGITQNILQFGFLSINFFIRIYLCLLIS